MGDDEVKCGWPERLYFAFTCGVALAAGWAYAYARGWWEN